MYVMFFVSVFFFIVSWTTGLGSWQVDFATGLAQLGIWVSLLSLLPVSSLYVSAKTSGAEQRTMQTYYSSLFFK